MSGSRKGWPEQTELDFLELNYVAICHEGRGHDGVRNKVI